MKMIFPSLLMTSIAGMEMGHFITGLQESMVFSSVQDLITCFLKSH